jgi:type II secretory ATPase GspE/PulE/Tfp pilus assembly ATPase PilB-like protein
LFELLLVDDALRDAVAGGAARARLQGLADAQAMVSLREDGERKAASGMTTIGEVRRAVVA